jgi:phosphohistidine phosphatase
LEDNPKRAYVFMGGTYSFYRRKVFIMKLYLIRHAQPKSHEEDPRMPLSDLGQKTMRRVSEYAVAQLDLVIPEIWHSEKLRAKETADILAESLGITDNVQEHKGLAPSDNVIPVRNQLMTRMENLAIVGHLPFLSKLTSLLLYDSEEDASQINFETGCIICLRRDEYNNWALDWMVTPDSIPRLYG